MKKHTTTMSRENEAIEFKNFVTGLELIEYKELMK